MDLQQRIERLEKQNRRIKLALLTTLGLLACVAVMGARPEEKPEIVKVRGVVLVDGQGQERARLATDEGKGNDQYVGLRLYNRKHDELVSITAGTKVAQIDLKHGDSKDSAVSLQATDQGGWVDLRGPKDGGGEITARSFVVRDADNRTRAELSTAKGLILLDGKGQERARLATDDGTGNEISQYSSLRLFNRNHDELAQTRAGFNIGSVTLHHGKSKESLVAIEATERGGRIELRSPKDGAGEIIAQRFVVNDASMRRRAHLSAGEQGNALLELFDNKLILKAGKKEKILAP